ncbi:MAG: DUF1963 domain-containing protein [Planctomycetaceae bacterium]|nr:DUF1963 domain-containing protein [Planctomycetaceae bacterium]
METWLQHYPYESFIREVPDRDNPQGTPRRIPPYGQIIEHPRHLFCVEQIRRRVASMHNLGKPVPVDLFLWATARPQRPYLTKLGGLPHRESDRPWPQSRSGVPYTFLAQFCFADSKDISPRQLPGEVMLVFLKSKESYFAAEADDVVVEWSGLKLRKAMTLAEMPAPGFVVPELSGVIHRMNEYPESRQLFYESDISQSYLLPVTQSTKIGPVAFYIQGDPREEQTDLTLIATLSAFHLRSPRFDTDNDWQFLDMRTPVELSRDERRGDFGRYHMSLGDMGCLYFFLNSTGQVIVTMDCY